tara:strand:+ start:6128 stop:6427 length:300 start_codon:yes stop_codon:yes gene_type:complete
LGLNKTEENMKNNIEKKILTDKEVAEVLSVSPSVVKNLAKEGKIPHFWVNRSLRFHSETVHQWINAGGTGAPVWKNNLAGYHNQTAEEIPAESVTLNRK